MLEVENYRISRVSIIDDDEESRKGYAFSVEDLGGVEPVPKERLTWTEDPADIAQALPDEAEAVLCDYHLRKSDYAEVNGDEIVEACYKHEIPAILTTSYTDWEITLLRRRRRYIPALEKPTSVTPESLREGFETCIQEFQGNFAPHREPSQTLARLDEFLPTEGYAYFVIPGWDHREKIRVDMSDLPGEVRAKFDEQERFYVVANVGAQRHEDLFLYGWSDSPIEEDG